MDTIKVAHGKTRMVAHRGVSKLERENTYAAFVAAGNRSYWGVETDVRTTADGNFIILHDETTERVSGEHVSVKPEESTTETLRAISLTELDGVTVNPALRLPMLGEYIRVCKKYEKHSVLELKSDFTEADIENIIGIIDSFEYLDNVTFISFNYENLKK